MSGRPEPMDTCLAVTRLCDHDDPWLRSQVEKIVEGAAMSPEKAVRIFHHVRDHVLFSLAYSRSRASQTLRRGYGECGNKTNAHVALLRAAGIPARLRWVGAGAEVLHHLIEEFVYRKMPPVASHFWCECQLYGRWISCESLLDRPLYEGMLDEGMPPLLVERIIAPVFYRLNLRNGNRLRRLARREGSVG